MRQVDQTSKACLFARASGLALALFASSVGTASAQPASETSDVGEVVVTASRVQAAGFTAPTPTSVISAAEVERTAPIQISEVLRYLVPSFRTTGATSTPNVYANL